MHFTPGANTEGGSKASGTALANTPHDDIDHVLPRRNPQKKARRRKNPIILQSRSPFSNYSDPFDLVELA